MNYEKTCQFEKEIQIDKLTVDNFVTEISVFTKLQNQVYGNGLECMKVCTIWNFYRTILVDYYKSSEVTVYKLKREECYTVKFVT